MNDPDRPVEPGPSTEPDRPAKGEPGSPAMMAGAAAGIPEPAEAALLLLSQFVRKPEQFWRTNDRQCKKTRDRFAAARAAWSCNAVGAVRMAILAAQLRLARAVPTLFISSFGSSGSHLLQHAIGQATPCVELGEIYIPQPLARAAAALGEEAGSIFIEAYQLIHAANPQNALGSMPIINTAHYATLGSYASLVRNYRAIFLFRDPAALVLSRTYRKGEYRAYLNADAISDDAYLEQNIVNTTNFYRSALGHPYDGHVAFEQFATAPDHVAATIARVMEWPELADGLSAKLVAALGDGASTNKYRGPEVKIDPAVRTAVQERMRALADDVAAVLRAGPAGS